MNNLFFKSSTGLTKNSTINNEALDRQLQFILKEQRHQRTDLQDIKRMLNRLLIDKHLQSQVDTYFEDSEHTPEPPAVDDLD